MMSIESSSIINFVKCRKIFVSNVLVITKIYKIILFSFNSKMSKSRPDGGFKNGGGISY